MRSTADGAPEGATRCGVVRRGVARTLAGFALAGLLWPVAPACAQGAGGEAAGATGADTSGGAASGATAGPVTNLPLPRYVSLRSGKVNVRRGPGQAYRIDWVFRRAGLPVRIVDEYGDWRRIVDSDNAGGWVYHALLSGRRTVVVTATMAALLREPRPDAALVAQAEQGVVARLVECGPDWCEIEADDVAGWVPKDALWGVEAGETYPD